MQNRTKKILSSINPSVHKGLEIGAFNKPIIKKEMGHIRYVDHDTTEGLKAKAELWGLDAATINGIVDVDFVWGDKTLQELTADDGPYDYVIASHVIEHVPDFIGWLNEIRSVLKPGGILTLAIPDKRFTFDFYREVTTISDVVEAFLQHSRKPTTRQIFDYYSKFDYTWVDYGTASDLLHENRLKKAWDIVNEAYKKNTYEDVHCWTFTDRSFLDLIADINVTDLLNFKLKNFFETTGNEFYVSLQATDMELNAEEKRVIQAESIIN
jgi:predicted SAM-dependent methyltransferase